VACFLLVFDVFGAQLCLLQELHVQLMTAAAAAAAAATAAALPTRIQGMKRLSTLYISL
jgi:hypothetical protein